MITLRARLLGPTSPDQIAWHEDGLLRIDDAGRIAEVGPWSGGQADVDLRPGVLMPGFVDGHLHLPQLRVVGSASGPLLPWLRRSVFPEETRFADPDHAATVAACFGSALSAAGTTTAFVYGSVHAEATDALLHEAAGRGLRITAGPVLMDAHSPPALQIGVDAAIPALEDLADRWHGHDDRLRVAACIPRFALSCSSEMMRAAGALAQRRGLWVSTHLSENTDEVAVAVERFGTHDYLQVYEDCGLIGPRSVLAHCVHLSPGEWDRFAAAGAVVAHCPDSNDFLGSGGMPIASVLERDIPVCIGTDVAAGRSFRISRILASAFDNGLRQGHPIDPARLLWWGTRGGALALGEPRVGALAPGLDADVICVDVPTWAETADEVLGWALLCHDGPWVRRTWVRGRVVWDRDAWTARGGAWPWEGDPLQQHRT